jgi:hypothetical protein
MMLAACDSGDIVEDSITVTNTGRTVLLTARVSGLSVWEAQNYHMALAGFAANNRYALVQKAIPSATADGEPVRLTISNISNEVSTVELALTNNLRKRIITIHTLKMDDYEGYGPQDTIHLDMGDLDLSRFGCMQYGLFDRACIQCHGGNGRSAGSLNLTDGQAYANLVDQPSTLREGEWRVRSGRADSSLMCHILEEGGENLLRYNHTEVLSSLFKDNLEEVKELIHDWINAL